jgi:hypothetical protein
MDKVQKSITAALRVVDTLLSWKEIRKINRPTPTQPAGNSLQGILGTETESIVLSTTVA